VLQRATKPAKELIAQNPPQNDLQTPSDLGPGFRKASSSSRCNRRWQQVAASRQQEQGCRAPDTTQCVTRCKNGEKCKVDVFRCYGTQSRAACNRQQQVKSDIGSPLAFSSITSQPRSFSYTPKMAKSAKCAFCVAMTLGHARQATGEILTGKSGLPELALLLSA